MSGLRAASRVLHASVLALTLVVVACSGPAPVASPAASDAPRGGGTLRIGVVGGQADLVEHVYSDMSLLTRAMFGRCCLARALLTYPGQATADGGTVLLPDLAEEMPERSRDGLTWTFKLREGVRYAPPHDSIEVTSADFVTAVERSIRLNGEVFPPYLLVRGTQDFLNGTAATVAGLLTPDPYTLVVRLARPTGALDFLADPSWSPIPAAVADGHDQDFGLFWPSTGPYMYATYPADPAATVAILVRNPSWSPAIDPTRRAEVDQIEISLSGGELDAALARVDRGELDFIHERLTAAAAQRVRSNPQSIQRVRSTASEFLYRLPINIALPPFDDIAVRRAVAFALDRVAARNALSSADDAFYPDTPTLLSQHMFSDSVTGGLLSSYDPFALGDGHGNISRARTQMSTSRYDADGDGLCDADVCSSIELPSFDTAAGEVIAAALEPIGINIEPVALVEGPDGNDMSFPGTKVALSVQPYGWFFELSGSDLSVLVKGGSGITGPDGFAANASLVGATPEQLAGWGYEVTAVPTVDDVIDRCESEVGNRRARCWAELDQLLAEQIVPWVPIFALESVWVSSSRVTHYTLDQATFAQYPSFDKVRLVAGSD